LPQQAQHSLSQIQADLEAVNLHLETEVREGHSVSEVLKAAAISDISAIAVSSTTIGKIQEM
jgi:hypothetical protein